MITMSRGQVKRALLKVNLARTISDHLLGEEHSMKHRMYVGASLMTCGVLIAQCFTGTYFHFLFEGVGYLVHGTGVIPFVDWFGREKSPTEKGLAEKGGEACLDC